MLRLCFIMCLFTVSKQILASEVVEYGNSQLQAPMFDKRRLYDFNELKREEAPRRVVNYKFPKRDLSIVASPEGYYPPKITVFKGEQIKFYFSTITKDPSCLFLDKFDLFLGVKPGEVVSHDIVFAEKGSYLFYCPSGKIRGEVVVLERPEVSRQKSRQPASAPTQWQPRDE